MTRYRFLVVDQGYHRGDSEEWGTISITADSEADARERAHKNLEPELHPEGELTQPYELKLIGTEEVECG
ncbi:MAG: hypothetical protein KC766_05045 [Myxococcales bacterium]|nr:hypothetical protein [Myxococcales bacterium]